VPPGGARLREKRARPAAAAVHDEERREKTSFLTSSSFLVISRLLSSFSALGLVIPRHCAIAVPAPRRGIRRKYSQSAGACLHAGAKRAVRATSRFTNPYSGAAAEAAPPAARQTGRRTKGILKPASGLWLKYVLVLFA
jgi:hypothetical protein